MSDVVVDVQIARPPHAVREWWTVFPPVYENAKEQPHRIVTLSRTPDRIETRTYWRAPLGRELEIPETFTLHERGWDVDIKLPFGLAQRDRFTLAAKDNGTHVHIEVDIWPRNALGRVMKPIFLLYAKRQYPRTWRAAAHWCEKATAQSV